MQDSKQKIAAKAFAESGQSLRRHHFRKLDAALTYLVKGFTESDCVARFFEMFHGLTK